MRMGTIGTSASGSRKWSGTETAAQDSRSCADARAKPGSSPAWPHACCPSTGAAVVEPREVAVAQRLALLGGQVVGGELRLVGDRLDHLVPAGRVEEELVQVIVAHGVLSYLFALQSASRRAQCTIERSATARSGSRPSASAACPCPARTARATTPSRSRSSTGRSTSA